MPFLSRNAETVEPIQRRKLYQNVMDRLVDLIRVEGYGPGDALPSEREIMDRYAVGRPAVREALQNLEWMGLITINHGERARVAQPSFRLLLDRVALTAGRILQDSPHGLEDLKQARQMFEGQMVRLAAQRATPADVDRLRERLAEHRKSLSDLRRFLHADMKFHCEIAAITGNAIYPALEEALFGWLGAFHRDLVRLPGAEQVTLQEHARILDAIAANDPDAAEQAMTAHLTRASDLYRRAQTGGADTLGG